jgi:hypothetical protein
MQLSRFTAHTPAEAIVSAANRQSTAFHLEVRQEMICGHFKDDHERSRLQSNFVVLPDLLVGKVLKTLSDIKD